MKMKFLSKVLATSMLLSTVSTTILATDTSVGSIEMENYTRLEQPSVSYTFAEGELAVVNFVPVWGDRDTNVASMVEYIAEAQDAGVKILLFPEMCVSGYASSSDPESETYQMPIRLAETVDGPTAKTISDLAVSTDMWIIYGGTEVIEGDDQHAYNSAFVCSPEGEVLSYQKIAPVEGSWCTPGTEPLLVDAGEYGLLGLSICYDTYANPEIGRYYAAMGCNILLNPTATSRSYKTDSDLGWEWYYKNRLESSVSREGYTMMSANLVGPDGPVKDDGTQSYNFPGGSVILNGSFQGVTYVAGAYDMDGTLTVEADIITGEAGLLVNEFEITAKTGSTTKHTDFMPEYYAEWYAELAEIQESGTELKYSTTETEGPVAAVVNMAAVWGDKEANLATIIDYIEEAAQEGVEFLVFPETVLSGYEYQDPLTDSLTDTDQIMQVALAETIPGASTNLLSEYAQSYDMYIVVGMTECEEVPMYEDGVEKVYNSAAIMYPDGTIESFQKMHRAGYESKWSVQGDTPVIIDTPWGDFGIDICRDGHFYPELGRYYAAMGCNVLIHPTATTGNPWYRETRIASYTDRDGMAAITCNLLGPDGTYDEATDTWSGGEFNSTSLIVTKYVNEEGRTSYDPETGYAVDFNGTGSQSEGYDERLTSPEGLEIAEMNLQGTGFSIVNFNARLYSEMYDSLAVAYREDYVSLYGDAEEAVVWENPFKDISESDAHYKAVEYAYENAYLFGVSKTVFGEDSFVTQGMVWAVLAAIADAESGSTWYNPEFVKAEGLGDPSQFNEQMTVLDCVSTLYAYATGDSADSTDDVLDWAEDCGILSGSSELDEILTRAELSMMMMAFCQSV